MEKDGHANRGHFAMLHQSIYAGEGFETEKGCGNAGGLPYGSDEGMSTRMEMALVDALTPCGQLLEEKPSFTFWTTLATCFDTQARAAAKGNPH